MGQGEGLLRSVYDGAKLGKQSKEASILHFFSELCLKPVLMKVGSFQARVHTSPNHGQHFHNVVWWALGARVDKVPATHTQTACNTLTVQHTKPQPHTQAPPLRAWVRGQLNHIMP